MQNIYQQLLKNCNNQFDIKYVTGLILLIRNCNNGNVQQKLRLKVFVASSKIIVKAMNNFFNLVKNVPKQKVLHTQDDIFGECYVVMDRCIDNVRIEDVNKFYYYLNSGLNRAIYRIYEKNYKNNFNVINNTDENEFLILEKGYVHDFDLTEIDLRVLSEDEMKIVKFKMKGKGNNVFLKKHNITSSEFNLRLNSVKDKLLKIYKNVSTNN